MRCNIHFITNKKCLHKNSLINLAQVVLEKLYYVTLEIFIWQVIPSVSNAANTK